MGFLSQLLHQALDALRPRSSQGTNSSMRQVDTLQQWYLLCFEVEKLVPAIHILPAHLGILSGNRICLRTTNFAWVPTHCHRGQPSQCYSCSQSLHRMTIGRWEECSPERDDPQKTDMNRLFLDACDVL